MKFYVKSNQLSVTIGGPHIESPMDAATEAFLRFFKGHKLSPLTIVSERGLDYMAHDHEEDHIIDTRDVLKSAGWIIPEGD